MVQPAENGGNGASLALRARRPRDARGTQCYLRLSPSTDCDDTLLAVAAVTFVMFCGALPVALLATSSARWGEGATRPWLSAVSRYLVRPFRIGWPWHVLLHFGRRLWFALLIGSNGYSASDGVLPAMVFLSLVAFLAVQIGVHPYVSEDNNRLQLACLLLLLYAYFVSIMPGSSTGQALSATVVVLKLLLLLYGMWRVRAGVKLGLQRALQVVHGRVRAVRIVRWRSVTRLSRPAPSVELASPVAVSASTSAPCDRPPSERDLAPEVNIT